MDKDKELIAKYAAQDEELRKLVEEHRALDQQLEEFHKRPYLTAEEEIEKKRIQVRKLALKDQILAIVEKYRKMEEGK
ncbi:MAG: YdcH family protein [Thermodesulfobacteria bacterium]|nr:YdcH family protein [Thermodesulfobacteriota bacterium]